MTTKEFIIEELKTQYLDKMVMFVEDLEDGRRNFRRMMASREHIIGLLEERFDDDLVGTFSDKDFKTHILSVNYVDKMFEESFYKEGGE
jgi:hypothetical protein